MTLIDKEYFYTQLMHFYDVHQRILPWRENKDPYRIWISEIMLQQTQVKTVTPYFIRFIEALPTMSDLAMVDEDVLYKLWEGLGYYQRAKNLKKAAQIVINDFGGTLPHTVDALMKLPGIGPYSASAIASIAFNQKVAAIDGNVLRVMTRITGNHQDIRLQKTKDEIETHMNYLLPSQRISDFNQAMMELGAMICLPRPLCDTCPMQSICVAYQHNKTDVIPYKSTQPNKKTEQYTVLLIVKHNQVAIRKRNSKGLLSSLWEFVTLKGHISKNDISEHLKFLSLHPLSITVLDPYVHIFTHKLWDMIGYIIAVDDAHLMEEYQLVDYQTIVESYALPTAFQPFFKQWLAIINRGDYQ